MSDIDNAYAIIMAGGSGTRFWPLSRTDRPKQFLSLGPDSRSLLRATAERVWALIPPERTFVVTSELLREQVERELPELDPSRILAEPVGRNTAPCIGWAATHVRRLDPDAVMTVLPADHYIGDTDAYLDTLRRGLEAATHGDYVTIGIRPTRAETGYGYIEVGRELDPGVFRARRFVEKPNRQRAEQFVVSGSFLWNSGMFFFLASRILDAIDLHLPGLGAQLQRYDIAAKTGQETELVLETYASLPAVSIDHGIMEKLDALSVVPGSFDWSDLGSWTSAWELSPRDERGNVLPDGCITIDASGNYVSAPEGKLVALVGVRDLVVVDSGDALLVVPRERAQDVRDIVAALRDRKDHGRDFVNLHVFRQYDIRGHAERDFGDDFVDALGRALGTLYAKRGLKRIAVSRDCRLSSPRLHEALCVGLRETGMNIVDIGVGPTPLLYFAVHHLDLDGGVQITGSHNPPDENGFKMMVGKGSLYGADIIELRDTMERKGFLEVPGGTLEIVDPRPAYVDNARQDIDLGRKDIRFAVDAGNGAGGPLALRTLRALGLDPVPLLCEMDGTFPVHHADPTEPETLDLLRERVLEEGLELGFAYDGDADRVGVVDARGEIIWGDKLMIILSRALLEKHPAATIIGEVKCSQTMYDDIAARGGRGILWKTGHSLIKTKMKEEQALLAGEMSGHLFFADRYYGFDDAIYATLRILEILSHSEMPLHEMLDDVPETFATPEIRVECDDARKFDLVQRVVEHYRPTHALVDIDGARIQFNGGWALVRASNTQPVLVLRFEADSEERLASIRTEVESVLDRFRDG